MMLYAEGEWKPTDFELTAVTTFYEKNLEIYEAGSSNKDIINFHKQVISARYFGNK